MPQGSLKYDPRSRRVEFTGGTRIQIHFNDLPDDIRKLLLSPPHTLTVDVAFQGVQPVFRQVLPGSTSTSTSTSTSAPSQVAPSRPPQVDYRIAANVPEVVLQPPYPAPKTATFQITDPGLGNTIGNGLAEPGRGLHPGLRLTQFSAQVPEVGGQQPDITRNPFNFVAFPSGKPWCEEAPHPTHAAWSDGCLSGVIEFQATSLTPLFVPEGFPFKPSRDQEREFLSIPRHFFRLPDAQGLLRYAIPGASLKGVLRSAVEALSNSRCGELNEEFYSRPIPYRRRVFDNIGLLSRDAAGHWEVQRVNLAYVDPRDWPNKFLPPPPGQSLSIDIIEENYKTFAVPGAAYSAASADVLPYRANLLYAPARNHRYSHVIVNRLKQQVTFAPGVIDEYQRNITHPHYSDHERRAREEKDPQKQAYRLPIDPKLELREGDLVFFTTHNDSRLIDSFGKNVNYLWPSRVSVKALAEHFFPPQDLSLNERLTLAERMFGFSGRHKTIQKDGRLSHPYRGKIRIETVWGPQAVPHAEEQQSNRHVSLRLAPLTAPATRAKSRPLYLAPRPDGSSATYDDPNPELKGRKFYWHQKSGETIWPMHRFDPVQHQKVELQCPPPFHALVSGTTFIGRIHFDNLTRPELGCLLYALAGRNPAANNHALKIGKGKPRGLGSLQFTIQAIRNLQPEQRYLSLTEEPESRLETSPLIEAFLEWVKQKSGSGQANGHLRDFDNLHQVPQQNSVRYYPINFSDYGWLPAPNRNPDQPNSGKPPLALPRARNLKP